MTTTKSSPRYYAMSWVYGRATDSKTGERIANYVSFATRAQRDEWCQGGPASTRDAGYREAVSASDRSLRRAVAKDQRDGHPARVVTIEQAREESRYGVGI